MEAYCMSEAAGPWIAGATDEETVALRVSCEEPSGIDFDYTPVLADRAGLLAAKGATAWLAVHGPAD